VIYALRELKTSVGLQDDDVIVLGGLTDNKVSQSRAVQFLARIGSKYGRRLLCLVLNQAKRMMSW